MVGLNFVIASIALVTFVVLSASEPEPGSFNKTTSEEDIPEESTTERSTTQESPSDEDNEEIQFCNLTDPGVISDILTCVLNQTDHEGCQDCERLAAYQHNKSVSLPELGRELCNNTNKLFSDVGDFENKTKDDDVDLDLMAGFRKCELEYFSLHLFAL
ncbi:uncharacterized protein LOC144157977 isoform X1 [Haemaphysalis longicornis]